MQFILGTNIEFTVERYKEEIGKPYSKIDLYLCNVSTVDSDINLKVTDENKVAIHGNSNQTISNQLTHEQNTNTNLTQNTNIPSLLITKGQQGVRQSPDDENGFENLFPSINFIQSLARSDAEDVHRLFESSLENEEEPCCSRNINPVMERKVYCPICNNPFRLLLRLKFRSARGASHYPAFMGNCQTISHTFYSLIYPVNEGNEV